MDLFYLFGLGFYQTWLKYVNVLDSNTFLRFTELVWCIGSYEMLSKIANPIFWSSCTNFAWLNCTRQKQSSTEKYLTPNHYVFNSGLIVLVLVQSLILMRNRYFIWEPDLGWGVDAFDSSPLLWAEIPLWLVRLFSQSNCSPPETVLCGGGREFPGCHSPWQPCCLVISHIGCANTPLFLTNDAWYKVNGAWLGRFWREPFRGSLPVPYPLSKYWVEN